MVGRANTGGSIMSEDYKPGFVDQSFQVTEQTFVPPTSPEGVNPAATPPLEGLIPQPGPDGTGKLIPDDTIFFVEILLNELPALIYPNMPPRRPDQIEKFNAALVRYCIKHDVDIAAYLIEEIGLAFMVGGLLASYRRDYIEVCKEPKNKSKEDELNADYDQAKEIDEQKTADISGE